MNSLKVKVPLLPNDGQTVIVELEDGTHVIAEYKAKHWVKVEDLQKSFKPVGVEIHNTCGISCCAEIAFNGDIVSWKGYI